MEVLIKELELGRRVARFRVKAWSKYAKMAGALCFYYAVKEELRKRGELAEVELKKRRLSMPVYEMTDADYLNPPWAGANYEDWKYRLIKVKGREIHNKGILIPKHLNHYDGFAYFLPLVHSEDAKLENQSGILLNKGWMPHEYGPIENRMRVEDAHNQNEYVGMLNRGEEYDRANFWKKGNAWDEQRWVWNNFYLPDMARAVKLQNEAAVRQGVIEVIDRKETQLDERDPLHYARDLSLCQIFPHPKTLAGALQPSEPVSDTRRKQALYALAGLAFMAY